MKCFGTVALVTVATSAAASDVIDARPLTDQIVMLHFKDGYVVHHKKGQKRSDEKVVTDPLDIEVATQWATYRISSADDPKYKTAAMPIRIGRKSKGTDFAWFVDKFENGRAINERPDHTKEHWIYLWLPRPMQPGRSYTVTTGGLAKNGKAFKVAFNPRKTRSEAVHVNLLGYVPDAPAKYAYVYHWLGDRGGLDLKPYAGRRFWLIDQATGQPAFAGEMKLRKTADNVETGQPNDTPKQNFQSADVYECDFSGFAKPGRYTVAVDGIGTSFPFRLDADVYREAFKVTTRGLYHNRSGIELKRPYTEFVRPAPHHPVLTPNWKGKLRYSTLSVLDYGNESSDRKTLEPTLTGTLEAWGWYQDAGDWDSYPSHMRVATELLIAFDLNPSAFTDGELNIPESGNGIPDLLDEAAWLPRFGHRLRKELLAKSLGTGGIGLRVAGDAFGGDGEGKPSWEDTDRIYVASGEDPESTFRYAGAAAHLAHCLAKIGKKDPEGVDWAREARESYAWALKNTPAKHAEKVRDDRRYAAAALFRLTGEAEYGTQYAKDVPDLTPTANLNDYARFGPILYGLKDGKGQPNAELLATTRAALFSTADKHVESANRRSLRWGGDFYFPMLVGQQTTPLILVTAVAASIADDPAKRRAYRATLYTTCDYFLGTNALNQTWVTGLGPRHPKRVFHMDAWYNQNGGLPHPGVVPYGPWLKQKDVGVGPWDNDWVNQRVYPAIDAWPGAERWFDMQTSPLSAEFTVHQNTAPSAAMYAILCAPRK